MFGLVACFVKHILSSIHVSGTDLKYPDLAGPDVAAAGSEAVLRYGLAFRAEVGWLEDCKRLFGLSQEK